MPYSYYYWGFDPTYILVLIGAVICLVASARVKSTYNKYASYRSMSGMTGAQAAERILHSAGIYDVSVQHVSGNLTDHYNPSNKTLNLSEHLAGGCTFDIIVTVYHGEDYAKVRIANYHTNIVLVEKNGKVLRSEAVSDDSEDGLTDRTLLDMEHIWDFATTVDISDVKELLDQQISCNVAIAEEGLKNDYGANIGKVLLDMDGDDVRVRAKAMAAAGSDARMNGCEMPVVINSGSGNQGITTSVPVIVYAKELGVSDEMRYRALTLSNLTTIHVKTPIGRLSAYCGAVGAGAGAGAGIAYLCGGGLKEVEHTVVNALAIVSGIVCDGAKASCAAKIAAAVDAGILGYNMYIRGQQFRGGDGIVSKGVENTLQNVGRLGKDGMKETNEEIIKIMIEA